jgi:fermentation-respiration switch protein FrsA (DUF1100 family)
LLPACLILSCSLFLTACGSGSESSTNVSAQTTGIPTRITNTRGALLDEKLLKSNTLAETTEAIQAPDTKAPFVMPVYAVKNYRLTYLTLDGDGKLSQASGMVSVPQKPAGFRSPIISFQHGTTFYDRETPSNDFGAALPPNILASLGYIVVTADYLGYGVSLGKKHPYLQANPSAVVVADFLTASRQWLAEQHINTNGQLFLTGYSEGGYVTLATQKVLQATGTPITATVAGAGSYDLRRTLDILCSSGNVSNAIASSLGLKSQDTEISYAAKYPGILDEAIVNLVMGILIPKDADITFDKKFLMDYMADDYATMSENSVYDWQATSPIRLTHGRDDETVPFENSTLALAAMRARGTQDIELVECMAVPSTHENCIKPYVQTMTEFFSSFAQDL